MYFLSFLLITVIISQNNLINPINALSASVQQFIQDTHNWRRSQLAGGKTHNMTGFLPTAKNMWTILYCPTCEASAQARSDMCLVANNETEIGCFLGWNETYTVKAFKTCLDNWWTEAIEYGVPTNLIMTTTGRYPIRFSQMAWANTLRVGCGITYCPNSMYPTHVFCKYNLPGNNINEKIYEPGPVCSGCPVDINGQTKCQYGLCTEF
uniref:SCP domain-containing protein n=1 Tax=Meloidogyne incognita TaxID=6306 RepID=A0A914M721_MELIC